jgi:pimeloyl-ACP methyl ester carboxylesterase
MIERFEIPAQASMIDDLRRRLSNIRWDDAVTDDWSQGTQRSFLEKLTAYWRDDYVWETRRAALNALPHRSALIDNYQIHFLHFTSGSSGSIPLLLMNGWPSSFVEYERIIPLLMRGAPSFDIVIPTHPGFGFSEKPTRPYQIDPAELYPKLMLELGYERFAISGSDVGAGIATRIALRTPEHVVSLHISSVAPRQSRSSDAERSDAEIAYAKRVSQWMIDEGGYQAIQRSKPQTLAMALADSPVGLASWIIEKFHGWTDHDGDMTSVWPLETLVDNLMIYWITNTIGSSVRYYYDGTRLRAPLPADDYVTVPTAIAVWPKDIAHPPRDLAARLYNVERYSVMQAGGHFPAWEQPHLYAEDIRGIVDEAMKNRRDTSRP